MKRILLIPLMVVLVSGLIFGGCAISPSTPALMPPPAPSPAPMPPGQEEGFKVDESQVTVSDVGESWATERMIVRTGNMWLIVNDVPIALDQIAELAEDFGGYVVSSKRWQERVIFIKSLPRLSAKIAFFNHLAECFAWFVLRVFISFI